MACMAKRGGVKPSKPPKAMCGQRAQGAPYPLQLLKKAHMRELTFSGMKNFTSSAVHKLYYLLFALNQSFMYGSMA